ncbi:MAG: diguanylate cyclase, partial [bacterium]|nr:diguanylate cyclase [bacterium]
KEGEFTSYTAPQHLLHNRVRCMMEDSSGYLWVGTYGGLTRLKNNSPKHYTDIDGLPDNKINCIYQDRKGILWIGTRSGPCRLKDGVITSIVTGDEFFSNSISAILEDNLGYTWMSSDKGLCRARRKQLNDFADGISDVIDTLCFTEEDGMKSSVCNGSAQPSAFKSKDGRLWFPTLKGVAMVDPAHLSRRRKSPPLVLEEILINGDLFRGPESEEDASAVFPPGVKKFEFHYTALSFINPEKIVFKYRLEGYDEDWVAVGNRRAAYYTNLNPGNYTFRVTASIDGKTWNTQPEAFRFHLEPYFFQTSWFLILCLVAALIPGTIFYRWRISKFEKRKRELEELVDERTRLLKIANRKLSETNSELKRIASMDGLTGIHNYRWFSEYLDLEWRRAYRAQKTITVILIDLDCFRQYNENYGHDTGDETLKKIARKLKSLCRRPGDVVARYGGEEFIAVFAETPSDQVVAPAGRILKGISDLNILHETSPIAPHVTASLGCATTVPGRTDSPDELIKIAHNALNQAKKDGKNRFIARKV